MTVWPNKPDRKSLKFFKKNNIFNKTKKNRKSADNFKVKIERNGIKSEGAKGKKCVCHSEIQSEFSTFIECDVI